MAFTAEALIVVVVVALLVIHVSRLLWSQPKLKLPPGPRAWPIVGSLHLLGTHPPRNLHKLAQKYGPVMSVWLGQRLCIVVTSPEAAKEFLKLQDANFSSRPPTRSVKLLMPQGIISEDITPVTRHLRKIVMTELMSGKRLEMSSHIRSDEMASMLRRLFCEAPAPTQLITNLNIMTSNVLSRMILNRRFLGEEEDHNSTQMIREFVEIVDELNTCLSAIYLGDFFNLPEWCDPQGLRKKFKGLRAQMDQFYTIIIDQHLKERQRKPIKDNGQKVLLDLLLEQQQNPLTKITKEHVQSTIWDLLVAGISTTTETTEWAISEVLYNPTVVSNARSELDCVVGCNRTVQESDIPNLKYIQAIVKETLRLHPPAPLVVRQNKTATMAFGYNIPNQTRLLVNVWAIGRSWERPLEFVPERFMEGATSVAMAFQGQHFEFLPFGSGRRGCPGMGMASQVVHFQVASLLHAFEWVTKELNVMEASPRVTLPKRDPLVAIVTPRLPPHCYQG